jgi:hypothetical protein
MSGGWQLPATVGDGRAFHQGLTLVHYSAQLETFLTQNTLSTP